MNMKFFVQFAQKQRLVEAVIQLSCTNDSGAYVVDFMMQEFFKNVMFIETYTDYKFARDEDGFVDIENEYDEFIKSGKWTELMRIVADEYKQISEYIEKATEYKLKENDVSNIVANIGMKLLSKVDEYLKPEAIDYLIESLNKLNPKMVNSVLRATKQNSKK